MSRFKLVKSQKYFYFCLNFMLIASQVIDGNYTEPTISRRILGGETQDITTYPFLVSLQTINLSNRSKFCGGAILNENWVITAGHCIFLDPSKGHRLFVHAGNADLYKFDQNTQLVKVVKRIIHPAYKSFLGANDIALLKLSQPLVYTEYVKPIKMVQMNFQPSGNAKIMGWGLAGSPNKRIRTTQLFSATVHIIPTKVCHNLWKQYGKKVTLNDVCATGIVNGVTSCNGDSGAPLIQYQNNEPYLIGITSYGDVPCGSKGFPTIYTRISPYLNFIKNHFLSSS